MSCKEKTKRQTQAENLVKSEKKNSMVQDSNEVREADVRYDHDTGYFRNKSLVQINSVWDFPIHHNKLEKFLANSLDTSGVALLSHEGLLHSFYTNSDTSVRTDTLKNSKSVIIQKIDLKNQHLLFLNIDGLPVKLDAEKLLIYDPESFRSFRYGKDEFYYFTGRWHGASGLSGGLVTYHLFYSLNHRSLSLFEDFRVAAQNFFGNLDGDARLDFVNVENDGGYGILRNSKNRFIIKIYSFNNKTGQFELLKSRSGKEYFIEGNSGIDRYIGDSMNITRHYWPKPLK